MLQSVKIRRWGGGARGAFARIAREVPMRKDIVDKVGIKTN
jgi:hypothetical protein